MNEKDHGINLPAIKKSGELSKQTSRSISTLDLEKKSAVNSILKDERNSVTKEILESEVGLDLVLVGDLTGSMRDYHNLLKRKFSELSKDLFATIKNLRIGIIFYLDHGSGDPYVTRIQKLTTGLQELIHFIDTTSTGSGGDDDEAVEDALNDLLRNMNWKQPNARSVVIFGDASPHPSNQCPHQYSFFDLVKELYKANVTINSVYCRPVAQDQLQKLENAKFGDFAKQISYLAPPNFFSWIANVTGGMVIGIESIEDLVDIITAAAAKDSGHLDDLAEKFKKTSPAKLKLVEVAKVAEQRKRLGNNSNKLLK